MVDDHGDRVPEAEEEDEERVVHVAQMALSPQLLVLLPTALKCCGCCCFFFFVFLIPLGLWERLFLCFKSFDCVLCFCSYCGMFYLVTVKIE